jgi:hypothetical protein
MVIRHLAIIGCVAYLSAVAGCRCPSAGCVPCTPSAPCLHELTSGGENPPELFVQLPDCQDSDCGLMPLPAPDESYQLLDAKTCQCHAATNANTANLVLLERYWAGVVIECDSRAVRDNLCLERDLLALHATGIRNKAAGTALETFYQLAGLEARKFYLEQALQETVRSLNRADSLSKEGLPLKIDRAEIAGSLSQLQDRQLQMDYLRVQLNGQLQMMLDCPQDEQSFYWPQIDWQVDESHLDADVELALGLAGRSDLRGLQLMICQLEKRTLTVARGVVAIADGTLGSVEPTAGIVHKLRCFRCSDGEVPIRCRQLALMFSDTQELATAEIKGAVYEVLLQQKRIVLSRQAVKQRRQRLHALTVKRDVDEVAIFELSKARGRLFEAESELIQQVVQLKIAQVRLRKAKGLLAKECGFEPTLCLEGCCHGACCRGTNCR